MSDKNAWDSDVYSATEYSLPPLARFNPDDASGLSTGGDDELQWPVSFEQLQAWGWKFGDEVCWIVESPSLCHLTIAGVRVAHGERNVLDGSYSWTNLSVGGGWDQGVISN